MVEWTQEMVPLKETASWMVYEGHSISHSLESTCKDKNTSPKETTSTTLRKPPVGWFISVSPILIPCISRTSETLGLG